MPSHASRHEESWLLLPWLANGRLSQGERLVVEEHLRECATCQAELARQRLMCRLLTEPERVTYAPGPSLRKLMDRIDGHAPAEPAVARPGRTRDRRASAAFRWRAPQLAWAASVVLAVGLTAIGTSTYRWSQKPYITLSNPDQRPASGVLLVAFERTLPVGEMEQLLHAAGARVVSGPDASGIFGIEPANASAEMRAIAARLRADRRVRWVQPLAGSGPPDGVQGRSAGGS